MQVVTRQSTIVGEIVPDTQWCNTSWYGGFGKSYDRVLVRVQLSTDRMTYDTGRVKSRVWCKVTETTAEKGEGKEITGETKTLEKEKRRREKRLTRG